MELRLLVINACHALLPEEKSSKLAYEINITQRIKKTSYENLCKHLVDNNVDQNLIIEHFGIIQMYYVLSCKVEWN
jgi:hypothetical protein